MRKGDGAKPIIFSGARIPAILDGRKTQTRRVVKPQFPDVDQRYWSPGDRQLSPRRNASGEWSLVRYDRHGRMLDWTWSVRCPYGSAGQKLWVRETWRYIFNANGVKVAVAYRASDPANQEAKWRPSIYLPRWASRITLEVTDVRVERVQDISEADARAEGADSRAAFRELWDGINGERGYGWDTNPWVWIVNFEVSDG